MAALVAAIHAFTHAPTDPAKRMDAPNKSGHDDGRETAGIASSVAVAPSRQLVIILRSLGRRLRPPDRLDLRVGKVFNGTYLGGYALGALKLV